MGEIIDPPRVALIVEDDNAVRELLEETDFEVIETSSADEALSYLREHASEVALALIDIRLPCQIDGVDLARTVRGQWPWVTVLVTSGHPGDRLQDLPRGAVYIAKPWRVLDVLVEAERAHQAHEASARQWQVWDR
jgi:DNA-binding response OmpR family regulator